MATTARLGIDIVAADRTRAAFASINQSMKRIGDRFLSMNKLFAGFSVGIFARRIVTSLLEINKAVPEVNAAFQSMNQSWTDFALKVGNDGLNEALINFAARINDATNANSGLSKAIGGLMGGAINAMASTIGEISRAAEASIGVLQTLDTTMKNLGVSIGPASGALKLFWDTLTFRAAREAVPQALTHIQSMIDGINKLNAATQSAAGKGNLPGNVFGNVLGPISNVTEKTDRMLLVLKPIPPVVDKIAESFKRTIPEFDGWGGAVAAAGNKAAEAMDEVGQVFSSSFSLAFSSLADGTKSVAAAFNDMVGSIISSLTKLMLDRAFNSLFQGGTNGGGILGSLFGGATGLSATPSFGGFYAKGGTLGAGQWGIAGENGPEAIRGPASIIPMNDNAPRVTIINNNGSHITQGRDSKGQPTFSVDDAMARAISDRNSATGRALDRRGAKMPGKTRG